MYILFLHEYRRTVIAGKADGAENVIRVKATVRNFPNETNMSVITEDGSFYTFSAPIIGA